MSLSRRAVLGGAGASVFGAAAASGLAQFSFAQTAAELPEIEASGDAVMTLGYARPGDGGDAIYRRVATEPEHPGKLRAKDGNWFELVEAVVRPEMFGAHGDGRDDRAALQAALDYVIARRGRLELAAPRYSLAGHLEVKRDARGFTVTGVGRCRLEQMNDNASIFYFVEGSAYWTIRGIEFAWTRDQGSQNPLSYGIRFDTLTARNFGHRNFEVADCEFVNGWRGIGVTPAPYRGLPCPVWGATFRTLRCSQRHAGALIWLAGFGKTGQPNIALEHIYIRGDAMQEAAIRLEGCDTVEMRGIEFNITRGPGIEFVYSVMLTINGLRFEQSSLARGGGMVVAEGASTRVAIEGMTLQNCRAGVESGSALVARHGARIIARDVVTVADHPPVLRLGEGSGLTVAATTDGGTVTLDGTGNCRATMVSLARADDTGVALAASEVIRLPLAEGGATAVVTQHGLLSELWITAPLGTVIRASISLIRGDNKIPTDFIVGLTGKEEEAHVRSLASAPASVVVAPGDRLLVRSEGSGARGVMATAVIARA